MIPKEITPIEACDIIDLAVEKWHEIDREHCRIIRDSKPCNCFRDAFGKAIIKRYGFSDKEMIDAREAQ